MKIHRVRLSDEEIRDIARALKWFTNFTFKKGLLELEDRMRYQNLHRRFEDWGSEDGDSERPLYRRTQRR